MTPEASKRDTRQALKDAIVRLNATGGAGSASIRDVARAVGITEGAIYRHFRSKEELLWEASEGIITEMLREKEEIFAADLPLEESIRRWIELTLRSYDESPDAFTFVLLLPHEFREEERREIFEAQGKLLTRLIRRARGRGETRKIEPKLAMGLVTGLMLNVPRMIREGQLRPPARRHGKETVAAALRVLRPE